MNVILGCDPGLSGALALFAPADGLISFYDMPTFNVAVNGSMKRQIDVHSLGQWLRNTAPTITHAWVEDVHSSPQMGVTSAFSFGFSAGALQAAIAAAGIPMSTVRPAVWTRAVGVKASTADASRQKASQLFPKHVHLWPNRGHHGRTDALLIAFYGSKQR